MNTRVAIYARTSTTNDQSCERQIFELNNTRTKALEKSNDLVKQILDNEDKITNIKKTFEKVTKSELSLEKRMDGHQH